MTGTEADFSIKKANFQAKLQFLGTINNMHITYFLIIRVVRASFGNLGLK